MSIGILASSFVQAGGGGGGYADEVLADSPLLYLRLADTSGTTAVDETANGRDFGYGGTYSLDAGAVGVTGGSSVDVNNGDASLASAAWMDAGNAISVEAWVNADTLTGTDNVRVIASRFNLAAPYHWHLSSVGSKAFFRVRVDSTMRDATGATTLSTGTNYHIVGTWDGSTARVYVNGSLDGSSSTSAATIATSDDPIRVGRFTNGPAKNPSSTYAWDGRIGEFAYYGSALSPARVSAHYAAGT